jgi:IS5 family transposase
LNNEKVYIKKRLKFLSKIKEFEFEKKKNSKMSKKRYFRKFAKRIENRKMQRERELAQIRSFANERRFSKKFLNKENLYFRFIKSNNRLLFTFLAFINKMFSTMTYMYDLKIFTRR